MATRKYEKYIISTQGAGRPGIHPTESFNFTQMFDLNDRVIKGSNVTFCVWFREPLPESQIYKPHAHDADEIQAYFGSNPDDPFNLNGEIEIWIEDEQYFLTQSSIIFIPKGVMHGPWWIRRIDKPILVFYTQSAPSSAMSLSNNPKWSHLPDFPEPETRW
jgi:hypothetical protein